MLTAEYVSNAGIILTCRRTSIGIDVLSRDENGLYPPTPVNERMKIQERIRQGRLGMLLFTHHHSDHFCAEWIREAAEANPLLRIVCTSQSVPMLEADGVSRKQILEIPPARYFGSGYPIRYGSFFMEAVQTPHEGALYRDVQNLMFIIRIRMDADPVSGEAQTDKLIIFPGDSAPDEQLFARMEMEGRISWLFAPFPYAGRKLVRRQMAAHIQADNIFALHLPVPEKDTGGWTAAAKHLCENAGDGLPDPVFPETPGRAPSRKWIL